MADEDFDGVTPDMLRAAEKREAAQAANRIDPPVTEFDEAADAKPASRRKTKR